MLAAAVGSIWYTFVDAVSGFNQIRNTKRAREVLAIVARSGKYLPVGLTFGPVNGPDDFYFVVDRAYAPGKGRRLRCTKEWIAYVDDLTVRTGRVVDGKFDLHGLGGRPGGTRGVRQGQLPSGSSEPGVCHGGVGFQAQAPAARRGAVGHQPPDQSRNL